MDKFNFMLNLEVEGKKNFLSIYSAISKIIEETQMKNITIKGSWSYQNLESGEHVQTGDIYAMEMKE